MERTLRRFAYCTLLVTFGLCLCPNLFAADDKPGGDTLTFKNGDKLTGHLISSDDKNVTFKSDMAGAVTVAWDKIGELHTAGAYAVLKKGPALKKVQLAAVPQGTLTITEQTITVSGGQSGGASIPTKETATIVEQADFEKALRGGPFLEQWNGSVIAGATLVRATQNAETFTGGINLARVAPSVPWLAPMDRTTIVFTGSYGKQTQPGTPDIKTAIYHAEGEEDLYFTTKAYGLVDVAFDHNFSQGLDLQQIYGGGLGITLLKTPAQQLDLKAQAQYEAQSFSVVPGTTATMAEPSTSLFGATFAEAYMRKWKAVALNQTLELIPAFNQTSDYSGLATVGVAVPVYKRFNLSVAATDNYLNDAAPGARKNSFQFVAGISYKLK